MKTPKVKVYTVYVSPTFPSYHPKAGQLTLFAAAILNALENRDSVNVLHDNKTIVCDAKKITSIRKDYDKWKQREIEINEGRAVLSVRQWHGSRFVKGQTYTEIALLEKIGVQKLQFPYAQIPTLYIDNKAIDILDFTLEKNDGLDVEDFSDWFTLGDYDLSKPLAILHFTDFRY